MSNPEINLKRHLDLRIKRLHQHEERRLAAETPADYEETVRHSDLWSSLRLRRLTEEIVSRWINNHLVDPQKGKDFLTQVDLGYAGETRIATVTATTRASAKDKTDADNWLKIANDRVGKHFLWQDSLNKNNRTIDYNPICWSAEISNDKARIYQEKGDNVTAISLYEQAYRETMSKLTHVSEDDRMGYLSAAGVSRVKQARLMYDLLLKDDNRYSLEDITRIFKEGRTFVHGTGDITRNFERSRVVEGWYTKFLLISKQYVKLLETLPVWLWLFKNHEGTRKMISDLIIKR